MHAVPREKHRAKLTQGPVGLLLIKLTIPMIWGLFAVITFNLVDTIYIGRLGTTHLAAISFTFPVVMVATNLAIGLGIGTSSVVARAIGEHDHHKIQLLSTSSLILSLLLVGVFVFFGYLTIKPLFSLIGANEDTLPLISEYMTVWYAGMVFLVVPLIGNYIIRATGDMLWPGIIMAFSALINIILDPILIFGLFGFPRLEMKGAAIATVIAWMFTFVAASSILYFREKFISFEFPKLSILINAWREILHVAFPAAGTHMIIPIGVGVIMSMVASFGKEAVAAFGAASRIEMFAFVIFMALSAIIGPFVGQNMGAKRYDRIKQGLVMSYSFCIYVGLIEALLLAIFSYPLMRLFSDNPVVVHYGQFYLYIIPLAYAMHGIIFIASGVFNASGHPVPAAVISGARMFLLFIPLAYILRNFLGIYGIFVSYTITTIIAGGVAIYWSYFYISKRT